MLLEPVQEDRHILIRQEAQIRSSWDECGRLRPVFFPNLLDIDLLLAKEQRVSDCFTVPVRGGCGGVRHSEHLGVEVDCVRDGADGQGKMVEGGQSTEIRF